MSGRVFEVPSNLYLFQAEGKCQFGIYKNDLGGNSMDLFIIGEPLLKNLYTVYDFEQDEIKLGVNIAATSEVLIYEPGKRPIDGKMHALGQTEQKEQKLSSKPEFDVEFWIFK